MVKIRNKLSRWKGIQLTFTGHVYLTKLVFHLLCYSTCHSLEQKGTCKKNNENIKKNFMGLGIEDKKIACIKWGICVNQRKMVGWT